MEDTADRKMNLPMKIKIKMQVSDWNKFQLHTYHIITCVLSKTKAKKTHKQISKKTKQKHHQKNPHCNCVNLNGITVFLVS